MASSATPPAWLFDALDDAVYPLGPLEQPQVPLEFSGSVFRLHTLIPNEVQIGPDTFVGPVDEQFRLGVAWPFLFGPTSPLASRLDTAVAAPLRDIVNLVIPGTMFPITIDLAQINVLRGRELFLPSGQEYLASLLDELGLDQQTTSIRGKQILTLEASSISFSSTHGREKGIKRFCAINFSLVTVECAAWFSSMSGKWKDPVYSRLYCKIKKPSNWLVALLGFFVGFILSFSWFQSSRLNSSTVTKYVSIASLMFSRASSSDFPWDQQPGKPGHQTA